MRTTSKFAIALPEDAEGDLLVDASHLALRTLPVAAVVRSTADLGPFAALADSAVERVRSQKHHVHRKNEVLVRSRRERRTT